MLSLIIPAKELDESLYETIYNYTLIINHDYEIILNELQKNDCIDLEKLYQVHLNYHNDLQKKKTKDAIQQHLNETEEMDDSIPDKKTLLN